MRLFLLLVCLVPQTAEPVPRVRTLQGPILVAEEVFHGAVTSIEDGDSLVVKTPTESITIHLEGIDAPEMSQPGGFEAKAALRELTLGKKVTVRLKSAIDHLARIEVDGADVSAAMIRRGMAWHCPRFTTDRDLTDAEEEARAAQRGLWSAPRPMPPWLHRRAGSCWEGVKPQRTTEEKRPDFSGVWSAVSPTDRAGERVTIRQDAVNLTIEHESGAGVEAAVYKLNGTISRAFMTAHGPADTVTKTHWNGHSLIVEERQWLVRGEEARNRRQVLWLDEPDVLNLEISTPRPLGETDTTRLVLRRMPRARH